MRINSCHFSALSASQIYCTSLPKEAQLFVNMSKFPWKVDDPTYPDYLQYEFVGYIFLGENHCLTDQEIKEFTEFYRLLWDGEREENKNQAKRLELVNVLKVVKRQKIEIEKRVLQEQIRNLESL